MKFLLKNSHKFEQPSGISTLARSITFGACSDSVEGDKSCSDQQETGTEVGKERPFKKAKYAWQVKSVGGPRYATKLHIQKEVATTQNQISSMTPIANLNVDARLEGFETNDVTTKPSTSSEENCDRLMNTRSTNVDIHPTYSLHRWQTKQMAQGVIDNAINNVLGDMGGIESLDANREYGAAAEAFYNQVDPSTWAHYLRAQNIENEGVAEAIRQQGLQKFSNIPLPGRISGAIAICSPHSTSTDQPLASIPSVYMTNASESNIGSFKVLEKNKDTDATTGIVRPSESEDILTTAVTCAINQKGLGALAIMPQQ